MKIKQYKNKQILELLFLHFSFSDECFVKAKHVRFKNISYLLFSISFCGITIHIWSLFNPVHNSKCKNWHVLAHSVWFVWALTYRHEKRILVKSTGKIFGESQKKKKKLHIQKRLKKKHRYFFCSAWNWILFFLFFSSELNGTLILI